MERGGSGSRVRRKAEGIGKLGRSVVVVSERWAFDFDGVASVSEPVEERTDEILIAEKAVPVIVAEIRRDDGCFFPVPLVHELEESVRLCRLQIQIAEFVDLCGAPHKLIYVKRSVMWSSSRNYP